MDNNSSSSSGADWHANASTNADERRSGSSCSSAARSPASSLLLYAFLGLAVACTVAGNLLVVASIAYFRQLRSRTNAFVLSLAAADCLVGVLVMPYSAVRTAAGGGCWPFGALFCRLHSSLDVMLCSASIFHLGCVAYDRYHAVCNPLLYATKMSPRRVAALVAACWAVPSAISFGPIMLGLHEVEDLQVPTAHADDVCAFVPNRAYAVAASLLAFYLPMGVMLAAYWKIYRAARRQAMQIGAMESQMAASRRHVHNKEKKQQHRNAVRREGKAAKTLGIVMGAFLLFWLPFFTVNIVDPFVDYGTPPAVWEAIMWIGYSNSSLNPFIYGFFNRSFRRAFLMIMGCRICLPGFSQAGINLSERVQ